MTKKLYIPVRAQRVADLALAQLTKEYAKKSKFKIVRNPGYRYELVVNK